MRFHDVVQTWTDLKATRSRKKKIQILGATLSNAKADLPVVATWMSGDLSQGRIGVGYRMLQACHSDAGAPAERPSLTVTEVDAAFSQINEQSGPGSTGRKLVYLSRLHAKATAEERLFLLELISGEVRQGAQEGVLLSALAIATEVSVDLVRRGFMLSGSIAKVTTAAFHQGVAGVEAFRVTPFVAMKPMLAQTAESPAQGLILLGGDAWFDVKLDGVRVQIHRDGQQVKVYTRHLKDVTPMVPDVVEAALQFPWTRFIVDAEAIALDETRRPRPFQVTMRRFGRTTDVARMRKVLPLSTVVFDVLLLEDRELLDASATDRFNLMEKLPVANRVQRARITDADEADQFYASMLAAGHEGVMAKSPIGIYQAGARGKAWLKIKPAHTLDLVILGAEWGSGRRKGWLSNLHLGAPDADGRMVMLGKTFKGLTDKMLAWQTERLQELAVSNEGHVVMVRPELVVEIAFNDVQQSPHYPGGIALRFARVKRFRQDKSPDQADRYEAVRALLPKALR